MPSNDKEVVPSCYMTNMFPTVFLTSRVTLEQLDWDEKMSSGQHTDFMLSVKRKSITVAVCTDIEVCVKN